MLTCSMIGNILLQVDVKCCCVFLSSSYGTLSEPSSYIPLNIRTAMSEQPDSETLVYCFPTIKLYSSGGRSLSRGMDVPVTNLDGPLTGVVHLQHSEDIYRTVYIFFCLKSSPTFSVKLFFFLFGLQIDYI